MNAFNFTTLTEYSGKNAFLRSNGPDTDMPAFATFNQIRSLGGMINKGAKGYSIFTGYYKRIDEKTKKEVTVPTHATVFHILDATLPPEFTQWLNEEVEAGRIEPPMQVVK